MSNGTLRPMPSEPRTLEGAITTLSIRLPIRLKLNPDYRSDDANSPRYLVYGLAPHGEVKIGAAWEKESSEHSIRPGERFLSISVDDPSFDAPLNLTAFPREGGAFEIVWRRQRQKIDAVAAQSDHSGRGSA